MIGNIHCKEAEFFPDFKTLISFYEPNPTLIKAYVHEDLIVHVAVKDSFWVESTKNPDLNYMGSSSWVGFKNSRNTRTPAQNQRDENLW